MGASAGADAPEPAASESLTQRVCRRVLQTAKAVDDTASITSVARVDADYEATLVRLRAGGGATGSDPAWLASALRKAWPLAHVAVVENVMEGTHEAQVVLPPSAEQRELAFAMVARRAWAGRMATLGMALAWASAATFGGIVVANLLM